jgi:hypothetical protein
MKHSIISLLFCLILSACATQTLQHPKERSFSAISSIDGSSVIREPFWVLGKVEFRFKSNSPVKLKLMKGTAIVLETSPTTQYLGSFTVLEHHRPFPAYFDFIFLSDHPTEVYITIK